MMLCHPGFVLPQGDDWVYERKYDGWRALALCAPPVITLITRSGGDYSSRFPTVMQSLKSLKTPCLLDGEIVAWKEGDTVDNRESYNAIRSNIHKGYVYRYVAFDVLNINGEDTRRLTLERRRKLLEALVDKSDIVVAWNTNSPPNMNQVMENGWEGIVAKRRQSKYVSKRSNAWIKVKV